MAFVVGSRKLLLGTVIAAHLLGFNEFVILGPPKGRKGKKKDGLKHLSMERIMFFKNDE